MTLDNANLLKAEMPEIFLAWSDTQDFVRKVRQDVSNATIGRSEVDANQELSFAALVRIVETVGERFGKFQDAECKQLKATLVKIEDRGSGRVRLPDFYKPALDGSWQFQESR